MHERSTALSTLLAAIDQERDPYQSTRVARALRRVTVRELDERTCASLAAAPSAMYNSSRVRARSRSPWHLGRARVLVSALVHLRDDARSSCLAGCIELVGRDATFARRQLRRGFERATRSECRSWLNLNFGAAYEMEQDLVGAYECYVRCGSESAGDQRISATIFALFCALRMGTVRAAESCLERVFDNDPRALNDEIMRVRGTYVERRILTGADPLAAIRYRLEGLGFGGQYLSKELATT